MAEYKAVKIEAGRRGWGGPLIVRPTDERPLIYSVTGGGIHPVALRIAELTGGEAFDGFKGRAALDRIAVAVVDCGGTARVGVYPRKRIPTVDVYPTIPAGPMTASVTEDIFVSGVTPEGVSLAG